LISLHISQSNDYYESLKKEALNKKNTSFLVFTPQKMVSLQNKARFLCSLATNCF